MYRALHSLLRKSASLATALAAIAFLTGASPSPAVEGDVDSVEMVFLCDFNPCVSKTAHSCVDLTVYPYEWHSGCYPP